MDHGKPEIEDQYTRYTLSAAISLFCIGFVLIVRIDNKKYSVANILFVNISKSEAVIARIVSFFSKQG